MRFLVITRSFQRARAADSAERLRAAVEALGSRLTAEGGPASTVSIGFAAFPFLPHDPDALSWEQTLELADHALRLTKRRRRNSYTGLRATAGLTAAAVREFLASSGGAPVPAAVEILMPDEGGEGARQSDPVSRPGVADGADGGGSGSGGSLSSTQA